MAQIMHTLAGVSVKYAWGIGIKHGVVFGFDDFLDFFLVPTFDFFGLEAASPPSVEN